PEDYSPALRFFNNGVPGLGLLTSPFPNPGESTGRRFVIEEYQRKLEYRESVSEALESGNKSTQSRGIVTLSEMGSENCKENTNPKTDKEGDDKFWYSYDDDETVITQEEEDRCHEISEEKEVFMIKIENEDEQKEDIEVENIIPGPSERTPNEINGQAWTQSMTPLYFRKITDDCHKLKHFALEVINRGKTIYLMEQFGYRLIAHDLRNLLILKEWIIASTQRELAQREYLMATGIDL
ncbi:10705_t:CDS:2, partial [Dentiscutata heterogama]